MPARTDTTTTTTIGNPSYSLADTNEPYAECIVEIEEQVSAGEEEGEKSEATVLGKKQEQEPKKPVRYKALTLGPAVVEEAVPKVPFDIYTDSSDSNDRVAWKPPSCHKVGFPSCMPVFFHFHEILCLICCEADCFHHVIFMVKY